jgi:hypothetical protein
MGGKIMNRFSLLSKLGPFALSLMLAAVFASSGSGAQAATGISAAPAPAVETANQDGLAAVDAPPTASTAVQIQALARAGGVAVAGPFAVSLAGRALLAKKAKLTMEFANIADAAGGDLAVAGILAARQGAALIAVWSASVGSGAA